VDEEHERGDVKSSQTHLGGRISVLELGVGSLDVEIGVTCDGEAGLAVFLGRLPRGKNLRPIADEHLVTRILQ